MRKLFVLLLVFLLALSVWGCGISSAEPETPSKPSGSSASSDIISSVTSRITEEDAIEIASQHWGIKSGDKDEATGFSFLIMPVGSSNEYITIALKWLVNNDHYSTVDMVKIDPFTGEIISGE